MRQSNTEMTLNGRSANGAAMRSYLTFLKRDGINVNSEDVLERGRLKKNIEDMERSQSQYSLRKSPLYRRQKLNLRLLNEKFEK